MDTQAHLFDFRDYRLDKVANPNYLARYRPVRTLRVLSRGNHLVMMMLRAYMDASGKSDDPNSKMVTVGGAVASLEQWTQFETKWQKMLSDFGVSELHMKYLAHFKNEYETWTEDRRRSFLLQSIEIMNSHCEGYMGATMPLEIFESLTEQQKALLNDPYYPCFLGCVTGAATCVMHLSPEEGIELFVSDEPGFKGNAQKFWERCISDDAPPDLRIRLASLTLGLSPKRVLPLQAADLVAYEVNNHLTDAFNKKPTERWPFKQIRQKMLIIEFFDRKTISERFGF